MWFLCGFGSLSVQVFEELYNVFTAMGCKEHKLVLISFFFFGSKCLHVVDLGLRVRDLEFCVI